MYIYAQIDNDGVCIGVSTLSNKVEHQRLISIPKANADYYLKRIYSDGQWSDEKHEAEYILDYNYERNKYIQLISDAETLGDIDEAERLRQEWQEIKQNFNAD